MTDVMTEAEKFLRSNGLNPSRMGRFSYVIPSDPTINGMLHQFTVRHKYIEQFGFAILTAETIEALRQYSPIVEAGSGSGYWAYEMKKRGLDIIATEPYPGRPKIYKETEWKMYTEFEKLTGPRAVRKYPTRTLLIVWPDYQARWPTVTLQAFSGETVIYVGEGAGGCTADDKFHDHLESNFNEIAYLKIPNFFGIHDGLTIYERKLK